jgi:neutral amino acid transport system substrate-binding protein
MQRTRQHGTARGGWRQGRAAGRTVLAAAMAAPWCASGCNVFESLEDCATDTDCALGERCHVEGRFCEVDDGPISIGAVLPLTGDFASFGTAVVDALAVAENEVNGSGGVHGRPIRFVIVDDQTHPALCASEAQRLIAEERVAAVLGGLYSAGALALQEVTFPERVLTVSPLAGSPLLSTAQPEIDRYFFRTIATMRTGSGAAVSMSGPDEAGGAPKCDDMVIVRSDDATGAGYDAAVSELFSKLGGCIVEKIVVPTAKQVDYEDAIAKLLAARPDCAHLAVFPDAGAEIVREFNAAVALDTSHDWSNFSWLGNTTTHTPAFLEAARVDPLQPVPSEAEGVEGADIDSTPPTKEYADFRVLYNQHLGIADLERDAPAFAANTYDAALLIALALVHAGGPVDRVRLRDGFWAVTGDGPDHRAYGPAEFADAVRAIERAQAVHYVGASGKLLFDATGTVSSPTVIWRVDAGAFTTVRRYTEDDIEALIAADPAPDPGCPAR